MSNLSSTLEARIQTEKFNYPHIVPDTFANHWVADLSNEAYHSDKTSVSSTGIKRILKSPLNFYSSHVLGVKEDESDAFRLGTAFHMALLEPLEFEKMYILQPEFKGTGSVAARKEWRDNQKPGAVILKEDEYHDLLGMLNSVMRHTGASRIIKSRSGLTEVSGYFRDPQTGLKCRIRPDFMHLGEMTLVDVKTTRDVEATEFSKTCWNYRYDIQAAFYIAGMELITGKKVRDFLYLAVEKKAPYECALYIADEVMIDKGKIWYQVCLDKLKSCLDTDSWEPYQSKVQLISLPMWALKDGF